MLFEIYSYLHTLTIACDTLALQPGGAWPSSALNLFLPMKLGVKRLL